MINVGRNLWGPHLTQFRVKFAASSCTACHSIIVTDDNKVFTWGRNDRGQLGHGDTVRRDEPTEVVALKGHKVVAAAVGRGHTLFLTSRGQVFACGENKMGQLGIGNQTQNTLTPTKVIYIYNLLLTCLVILNFTFSSLLIKENLLLKLLVEQNSA